MEMVKLIVFIVPLLYVNIATAQQAKPMSQKTDSICEQAKTNAWNDINADKVKYYSYGIVAPSLDVIKTMANAYNVKVISGGCIVSSAEICYNEVVNEYYKKKIGKTVSELMKNADTKNR